MNFRAVPALCICLLCATNCGAQTVPTQQSIEAKLKGPFLMLRGTWNGEKLAFDSQGNLSGNAEKTFFSLSAVLVTQIQLSDTQLEIRGRRAVLDFSYKEPLDLARDLLSGLRIGAAPYGKGDLDVVIARDAQHPDSLDAALDKVFSVGIDQALATAAPFYWQSFLERILHPDQHTTPPSLQNGIYHPGPGITPPIPNHTPDPGFSQAARRADRSGVVVIGAIVGVDGIPRSMSIVRPLGRGFDEFAVYAVGQFRFKPAIYRKQPVPMEVYVEVNFRQQ